MKNNNNNLKIAECLYHSLLSSYLKNNYFNKKDDLIKLQSQYSRGHSRDDYGKSVKLPSNTKYGQLVCVRGPSFPLTVSGLQTKSVRVLNRGYSGPGIVVLQHSSQIKSKNFSTTAEQSQSLRKSRSELGVRLSNLASIYNSSSPIFKELLETLNNEPLNDTTQLKIEKFLLDQAAELNNENLESGEGNKHSNISNALTLEFIESKKILAKLIKNYQTNLKLEDAELTSLASRIMCSMDAKFLIAISYGRILNIINSHQQVNKLNKFLEVSIELGKEIVKKYLLDSYHAFLKQSSVVQSNGVQVDPKNKNTKISLLMWKNNNKTLVESTEDSQFRCDLGNILVSWMVQLKLIKVKLIIINKKEKLNILVPGDRLEKLIPSSNVTPAIFSLPHKLPMIVKPKLYLYKGSSGPVLSSADQHKQSTTPYSVVQPCSSTHKIGAELTSFTTETNCESLADMSPKEQCNQDEVSTLLEPTPLSLPLCDEVVQEEGCKQRQGEEYQSNDDNIQLGGYLLNGIEYTDKIISRNWELSTENKFLPNNSVFDMVNFVNSVQFKINENVLDFILANNYLYNFFIDPNYIHPLTLKSKLTKGEGLELEKFYSQRFTEQNILGLAILYSEVPSFYLPVRLDYRGRLYCIVEYLNFQGIELAKSLLEFSVGEKVYLNESAHVQQLRSSRAQHSQHCESGESELDPINYLKIFGANCYGNKLEKKSFNDRISWVEDNLEDIINFRNGVLLNKAENKLLFLSFCFEFNKYIQALNQKADFFITNLPIQFDAAVNGFQHLTLLVDDVALSKKLNLDKATWSDVPEDFYTFVGLKLKDYFINKLNNPTEELSEEVKASYKKLSLLDLFRSLIKYAIMTIPYNATALTIVESIKDSFDKLPNPDFNYKSYPAKLENYKKSKDSVSENKTKSTLKLPAKGLADWYFVYRLKSDPSIIFTELDFQNLRRALSIVIFIDYPKLSALLDYLKTIADISNKLKLPIPWILPTGLVVQQQFYATEKIKVKPFIYTKNLLNLTIIRKDKFNNGKQKVALMPNLVHSLDAASLCIVINNYFNQDKIVVAPTTVNCSTNSTNINSTSTPPNKGESLADQVFPTDKDRLRLCERENNINFYSIHDCFAVPCNKMSKILELLKTAYIIIYSKRKYLLEFDANFITSIKNCYGENAVSFNEKDGKITIKTDFDSISFKYIPINKIIDSEISQINVSKSSYLAQ
jgi:DNA-dependent RNA polymerase